MNRRLTVKDIDGPWVGEAITGLMERCRDSWETPLCDLSDLMVVTYLNQNIATAQMLQEAKWRLENQARNDSELFDGQLEEAIEKRS